MVEDDGIIKEIHKVIGGPYDGIYVNQRFENLLEDILERQGLQSYQSSFHPIASVSWTNFRGKNGENES